MKMKYFVLLLVAGLGVLVLLTIYSYREAPLSSNANQFPDLASKTTLADGIVLSNAGVQTTKMLIFCSDPWPPYAGHAGKEKRGYIVEVLSEIYEPLGYNVRYVNKPWSRCISETRAGKLTALAGADVDEVPDFVFPEETVGITRPAFFVLQDNKWVYSGIESLSSIKLGMIQDYTYEKRLDEYIEKNLNTENVMAVKGNDPLRRLIEALQAGHIDALVENAPVVYHTARQMNIKPNLLKEAGAPKRGVRLFVPFSPAIHGALDLANHYDQEIRKLRANGRLTDIMKDYGLVDWREQALEMGQE